MGKKIKDVENLSIEQLQLRAYNEYRTIDECAMGIQQYQAVIQRSQANLAKINEAIDKASTPKEVDEKPIINKNKNGAKKKK